MRATKGHDSHLNLRSRVASIFILSFEVLEIMQGVNLELLITRVVYCLIELARVNLMRDFRVLT
jgi:hypothetical protein